MEGVFLGQPLPSLKPNFVEVREGTFSEVEVEDDQDFYMTELTQLTLALVGFLDLYRTSITSFPRCSTYLPLLVESKLDEVVRRAKEEWTAVIEYEASKPGLLAKKAPYTAEAHYRELMSVWDLAPCECNGGRQRVRATTKYFPGVSFVVDKYVL